MVMVLSGLRFRCLRARHFHTCSLILVCYTSSSWLAVNAGGPFDNRSEHL